MLLTRQPTRAARSVRVAGSELTGGARGSARMPPTASIARTEGKSPARRRARHLDRTANAGAVPPTSAAATFHARPSTAPRARGSKARTSQPASAALERAVHERGHGQTQRGRARVLRSEAREDRRRCNAQGKLLPPRRRPQRHRHRAPHAARRWPRPRAASPARSAAGTASRGASPA